MKILARILYISIGYAIGSIITFVTATSILQEMADNQWAHCKALAAENGRRGCMMTKVKHQCNMSTKSPTFKECTKVGTDILTDLNEIKEAKK